LQGTRLFLFCATRMTANKGSSSTNVPSAVENGAQRHGKSHGTAKGKKPAGSTKMPLAMPSVQVPKKVGELFSNANVPIARQSPSRGHNRRQEAASSSESSIIQMLLAASQRSVNNQQHSTPATSPSKAQVPKQHRPRKNSLPSVSGSGAYAGAAFDRAPTAESFPVPSFLKQAKTETAGALENTLSTSCPMRSIHLQELFTDTAESRSVSPLSPLRSLVATSPSPPTKSISLPGSTGKRRTDLQALTNDLRKILKLPTPSP
jgi:hypothetical protein